MNSQEPITHPASAETIARASKVGPKASIQDIRLIAMHVKVGELGDDPPSLIRHSRSSGFKRNQEDSEVFVSANFTCDLAYDAEAATKRPAVTIEAAYALLYKIEGLDSFEDADLKAFAELNGYFNAWPFWRELQNSMFVRMGIFTTTLPTFRVTEKPNSEPVVNSHSPAAEPKR